VSIGALASMSPHFLHARPVSLPDIPADDKNMAKDNNS
jgi:hypothetical protein